MGNGRPLVILMNILKENKMGKRKQDCLEEKEIIKIIKLREVEGITIDKISERMNISRQHISKILKENRDEYTR